MVNVSIFGKILKSIHSKKKELVQYFGVGGVMMRKPKINLPKEWENATSVFSEDFFQISNRTMKA